MRSIIDMMYEATGSTAPVRFWESGRFAEYTWADCVRSAEHKAAGLRAAGLEDGEPVACIFTNSFHSAVSLLGVWLAGGTALSLPTPSRGISAGQYALLVERLCARTGAQTLLIEERLIGLMPDRLSSLTVACEKLDSSQRFSSPLPPDRVSFVQYSSGSTEDPRGCAVSTTAMTHQIRMLSDRLDVSGSDKGCSWLPLSHDMGMFVGWVLLWSHGGAMTVGTPERFVADPGSWMQDCANTGATLTIGPTSALDRATAATRRAPVRDRLKLRLCGIAAERTDFGALQRADSVLGPQGLDMSKFTVAYGLAEAVAAVSVADWQAEPETVAARGRSLLEGRIEHCSPDSADAVTVVSTGRPLDGVEVSIDGDRVGEIVVSTPSGASGYLADPDRSAQKFADGQIRTGDFGFMHDDALYVVGRSDDVLSVSGLNLFATELEAGLEATPGVRRGNCVLVDVSQDGAARLVVVAEPDREAGDLEHVAASLAVGMARRCGVRPDEVVFVERGVIPKTPSGKVQRFKCRELLRSESFEALSRTGFRRQGANR